MQNQKSVGGTRNPALLDATCRVALAGLLHDLGKFAERADMPVPDAEALEVNKQIYCPNPKPHPNAPGWFSHVHAAYTALALDAIEPNLPPIKGRDAHPFREWGEARGGGADDSLINAAAKHHKPESFLQWIVATADRAASGLDRETFDAYNQASDKNPTTGKSHYTARQCTLFEQISIEPENGDGGKRTSPNWNYRYQLAPLTPHSIFPMPAYRYETNDQDAARAEYAKLWQQFRNGLEQIPKSHRGNLSLWLDHFDSLWMTFTQAVPAATAFETIPDVSLYDHSRVVAALAAAIWRYHYERGDDPNRTRGRLAARQDWNDSKLLFVQGDLFGIQDFIFASGGETTKNAAKLLRGRSFFVTLLSECAALRVLDALSLPGTSQIINAAGKFQIIAPNTGETIETLSELRNELDEWFLRHAFGQSGIGIAWTPATCNDLQAGGREAYGPYQRLMERLFRELEEVKLQRFDLCTGSAPPPVFEDYLESISKHRLCSMDGRSPADGREKDGERLSRLASDQIEIGGLLTKQNRDRLLVTRNALSGPNVESLDTDVFGLRVAFTSDEEASGSFGSEATAGSLLRAWDFSLPEEPETALFHGYARRDINAWVPRFNEADLAEGSRYGNIALDDSERPKVGNIKPFNQLACESRERRPSDGSDPESNSWIGTPALMTLKGDVDNLGTIFQHGLMAPSLSRMVALSRQMNAFFSVHLPYLCRTEFPTTYTVFAGGDDFFLIGPWSHQVGLASRLRGDFHKYAANNGEIGFSAGLAMTKPGLPVRRFEAMAEESIEKSKAFQQDGVPTKNAVTCFGRTVDWTTFRELLGARKRLRDLIQDKNMSHGYAYALLHLVELAESVKLHPENARWRSRFYYLTSRAMGNVRGLGPDQRKQRMEELAAEIVQGGIERFRGDYRVALFGHLYRNRN